MQRAINRRVWDELRLLCRAAGVFAIALFALAATTAHAQPESIKVRKGDQIDYAVRADLEVTEILGDTERSIRAAASGLARLTVERVTRSTIRWTYSTPTIHLLDTTEVPRVDSSEAPHSVLRLSTDRTGRVSTRLSGAPRMAPLLEAIERSIVMHWFQPAIFRKMHPGDTWKEKRDDPIVVDDLGINARSQYDVTFAFEGIVDTLGTRAVRLRWRAPTMTITGTRSVGGYVLPLRGDGEHEGVAYFSTIDGLLLAGLNETSIDLRTPPALDGMVTPMMWRLRSAAVRR